MIQHYYVQAQFHKLYWNSKAKFHEVYNSDNLIIHNSMLTIVNSISFVMKFWHFDNFINKGLEISLKLYHHAYICFYIEEIFDQFTCDCIFVHFKATFLTKILFSTLWLYQFWLLFSESITVYFFYLHVFNFHFF